MKIKYVLESLSSGVEPKERAAELEWTEEQLLGAFDEESGKGEEEFLTVFDCEFTVGLNNIEYTVKNSDSIRFKADRLHTYHNS